MLDGRMNIEDIVSRIKNSNKTMPSVSKVMRTPRSLTVEITARCNLRCRYCYFFNNPARVYRDLPTQEWLTFFDELGGSA